MFHKSAIAVAMLAGAAGLFAYANNMPAASPAQAAASEAAVEGPTGPVLLELFTSQGCSSCPPADRLAAKLAEEDGLIVVSRPVTYWDRLGWKDTLAKPENTDLQRAYARSTLEGRNGVYTPQLVVDGTRGEVGSNETRVRRMIRQEQGADHAIIVNRRAAGGARVTVSGDVPRDAELVLLALDASASVAIGRGENRNRTVHYTNVLLGETKLSPASGQRTAFDLPGDALSRADADRYALVLRLPNAGKVLASRLI